MPAGTATERFALLARLPALASLEEKIAALADAAYAALPCSDATVIVFADGGVRCAHAPGPSGFTLREGSAELRRLMFPALAKYARAGCYAVAHDAVRSLGGLTEYAPSGDLVFIPLETPASAVGAIVFDVAAMPADETLRDLRTFADVAAWMIAQERELSAAEREAKQSALLAQINERARKSFDRQSILEAVVEDVRRSFDAMRCVVFGRDGSAPEFAVVLACAESARAEASVPARVRVAQTWLERVLAGSVVSREDVSADNPRDGFLRASGARSALMVPLAIEGRIDLAIALHFGQSDAFDELDVVMMRSIGSHVGLALANVQLYDFERLRRSRAESLERVVRMLRDTQTIEEVLLVFAVTVAHESRLICSVYQIDGPYAVRRAMRAADGSRERLAERVDIRELLPALEAADMLASGAIPARAREVAFGGNEGLLGPLRIDGQLWGFVAFGAASGTYDWTEPERKVYFHMLASHLELALSTASGFERVQQLARALSESNEFKDDLLAMLAHDFKGPLTVILGYSELLLENAPPQLQEDLETISSQTKRLVRLAEDAVALAQTQAGGFSLSRTELDLRDLVTESVKAHNLGEERIRLSAGPEAVPVLLDAARFNHVLDNLLMNALKYSEQSVEVTVFAMSGNAVISIADRGIGIPEPELGTVFARFGRATNARRKGISGSGVGLYVSRKIVEVHGGSIGVQSVEGDGSTFTVTLPLAGQQHQPSNGISSTDHGIS